jgi:hypothetical protein
VLRNGGTRGAGEEIVVRACVGGGGKSRSRAMLTVIVRARRGELGPVTRLAVTKLRVSWAEASAWTMVLTALRILANLLQRTALGPWRLRRSY